MKNALLVVLAIGSAFFSLDTSAQVATGTPTYGTFSNGPDVINIGNLNVHWSIPVLNKAGRGSNFVYNLPYDSSIWYPSGSTGSQYWTPVNAWGWQGISQGAYISYAMTTSQGKCGMYNQNSWQSWNFSSVVYMDQYGVSHPFANVSGVYIESPGTSNQCPPAGATPANGYQATATDGSGITIYCNFDQGYMYAYIVTPSGATVFPSLYANYTPPSSWQYSSEDSNGNEVAGNGSVFTDTTGKTALTVSGNSQNHTTTFSFSNTSGSSSQYLVTFASVNIKTHFQCTSPLINEYAASNVYLVSTIELPDTSKYTFNYEQTPGSGNSAYTTGRIASVQLPTGDTISYQYPITNDGINCADGSTSGLTRTLNSDSGSPAQTWTYARTQPGGVGTSHTEVVDGLGNHLNYDFVEASNQPASTTAAYYETHRNVYQGAESGTAVLSRYTCYNGTASPCTTSIPTLPFGQIDTYETLNGLSTHGSTTFISGYGMPTESKVYDFASGASRGPVLRDEKWTYGYSIPNLPTQDEVFDGSGNEAGNTTYGYDQTTPTASSGVLQHLAVGSIRGNLTTMTSYANATTSYSSTATYEDTGSVLTSTTPNGTTTLSYDAEFVYNTGATLPTPSSGFAIKGSETFDTTYTGLPLTATDPNSQITQMASYDAWLRPTEIKFPDGGQTTWSYTPTSVTTSTLQTTSVSSASEAQYDGYGRPSRTEVANGQGTNPYYQQDTCYDANGNAAFSSYPYQSTGFGASKVCSGSGDTYSYDVMGRVLSITRANGETRSYTYTGRATESVDENGVTRVSQVDGLGRPTIVCEVSSASLQGVSPVSCGTDIIPSPSTGFVTTYAYTLATPTTTITQGAQTRTFQSDWLGRPTSVTEPERGTTTYGYAYNSTGLQVTRTRPRANQTGSLTTATTTQSDALGRTLTISYNDGVTPSKVFAYDGSAGWGYTQNYLIGRLSSAAIPNGSAATIYGYDAVGRTALMEECTPSNCGSTPYPLNYTYDLAGDLLTSTDGAGVTSTYAVSQASELQSLTSSLNNSNNPPSIVSSVQNGANGPIHYGLGNGLSSVYGYDSLGRLNGGWVCTGSTSPTCSGGSQVYGFTNGWKGTQLQSSGDSVNSQNVTYGYDGFNRLASLTTGSSGPNYAWVYDRYGNRWQQNVTKGTGWPSSLTFSASTNQVSGLTYDAAGNVTYDGSHYYTYDAEGNITAVDPTSNPPTATYVYDALNHRVRTTIGSGAPTEFVFNAAGQRVSEWNASTHAQLKGHYYWGGKPVAFYASGAAHFQHQDWLGTERMRTTYSGGVEGSFTSLPFGDGLATVSGSDTDANHYATLDHDYESDTEHAQFRQYSSAQGRWLSPDPYSGSYDFSNPQSFDRYVYVMNNPLGLSDPSGKECVWDDGSYDAADEDPYDNLSGEDDADTGTPEGCAGAGGTYVPPAIFEAVEGNQPGSWSDQPNAQIAFDWTTPSAIVFGGPNAAQQETAWVVAEFLTGTSVPEIVYTPQDPFTLSFQKSAGMAAINAQITAGCPAQVGGGSVGSGQAFVNTLIDGIAGGQGFLTPEAQLGAFTFTYASDGGTTNVNVQNPISFNSLNYHLPAMMGIQNPTSGPQSTVKQTLQIQETDPCLENNVWAPLQN